MNQGEIAVLQPPFEVRLAQCQIKTLNKGFFSYTVKRNDNY